MIFIKNLVLLVLGLTVVSSEKNVVEDYGVNADRLSRIEKTMVEIMEQISDIRNEMKYQNDTEDLESRVLILELEMDNVQDDVVILYDDIIELINQDSLTDLRLITVEGAIEDLINADAGFEDRIANLEEAVSAPWTACESSPCDNGATCVDVNADTFVCLCRDGFFGITCSESYTDAAFLATFTNGTVGSLSDPIVFDVTRFNLGENYDVTTGIYTAPMNGIYLFSTNIRGLSDDTFGFSLRIEGAAGAFTMNTDLDGHGFASTGLSVPLHLTAGQEAWVSPYQINGGIYGAQTTIMQSWFAGYLISAD